MRKTKIVCTIGPATNTEERVAELIRAGMNVARLNFSHGSHQEHAATLAMIRRVSQELGTSVAVMQDLQGPKIRTGPLKDGLPVQLRRDTEFLITPRAMEGSSQGVSTNYQDLTKDVKPGDSILLDDGLIELEVIESQGDVVRCRVVHGGTLGTYKGINLPGVAISAPSITEKDLEDLAFGLKIGVDYVALSFVRRPSDIVKVKEVIRSKGKDVPAIAKLEKPEALDNLEAIMAVADGIMVARGDLGVELPPEKVPAWQKRIISAAARHRIPVITATQMLESMVSNPRPTRAEASDVANAIFDGTDAIMLSEETAVGAFPVEAVMMMDRIAQEAEGQEAYGHLNPSEPPADYSQSISRAACQIAHDNEEVVSIVAFTVSGYTARLISKDRPRVPLVALTPHPEVYHRLALLWGVTPLLGGYVEDVEAMVSEVERALLGSGYGASGQSVVIVGSLPVPTHGPTNFLKLHRIG